MLSQLSIELSHYLFLANALFIMGFMGILLRRTLFPVFLSMEVIGAAVYLNFIIISYYLNNVDGNVFVILISIFMIQKSLIGLSIYKHMVKGAGEVDLSQLENLKG